MSIVSFETEQAPNCHQDYMARQKLMAEDLGPIVNYLSLAIYDMTGQLWQPQESPDIDEFNYQDLSKVANSLCLETCDVVRGYCDGDYLENTRDFVAHTGWVSDGAVYNRLTHFADLNLVLEEGLRTGIVMPLNVYRSLHYNENGVLRNNVVDIHDLTSVLNDKSFQAAILKLSKAPNGVYKASSSDPTYIQCDGAFDEAFGTFKILEVKEDGTYSIRPEINEILKEVFDTPLKRDSIGCPVRFGGYRSLGTCAMQFAKDMNINPNNLMYQSKSAIVAGCELVANSLQRQAVYSEQQA